MFWLVLYYYFARLLPPMSSNILSIIGGSFRNLCGSHLFLHCGNHINIEHGVSFGNGAGIELGIILEWELTAIIPMTLK